MVVLRGCDCKENEDSCAIDSEDTSDTHTNTHTHVRRYAPAGE
jgi:hypothetical protein